MVRPTKTKRRKSVPRLRLGAERLEARRLLDGLSVATTPAEAIELRAATIGFDVIDDGGNAPILTLYWGDEDGGTNGSLWDNSISFGVTGIGPRSAMLTDLDVNQEYFYRAFAFSLGGGLVWTDVASFQTLPPQLPTAQFGAIEHVNGTGFEISAEVLDDGGDPASFIIYYGTDDGGDDPSDWQSSIDLGIPETPITTRVTGLLPGTEYFVRPSATNGAGPGWGTTAQIQTIAIAPLRISEFMAANSSTLETRVRDDIESRFQRGTDQALDWIEIQNALPEVVDISGYHLTDNIDNPTKWTFPAGTIIPASGQIVVYASGYDFTNPEHDDNELLHTNFKISRNGEYLGITDPSGATVHRITDFPRQEYDASFGYFGNTLGTFRQATPNEPNVLLGPELVDVAHVWANDDPSQEWTITARLGRSEHAVESIEMAYRVMFDDEIRVAMVDDGTGQDQRAGDGLYTAVIPAGVAQPGQMLRYYVGATDANGTLGRAPLFANPTSTAEYFGTMIPDVTTDTQLPVLHRFVADPARANNTRGTRASVYFDGEFYDNVFLRSRGGTAQGWPKKAFKFEFNDDHHFEFRDGVPRVDEINVNTTYTDKSYTRAIMTSDFQNAAGSPSPESFHVRMHENGEFFSVAIFVEQLDRDFLRRHGLDTEGSFYKGGPGSTLRNANGLEKKTRDNEDNSDLVALIDGLKLTGDELEHFLFDNINLPAQINFMATVALTQNIDASDKNYFLYRDTNGTGEWHMLPWDLDLTFGPDALNTDRILADENTRGASNPNAVHPYIGSRDFPLDSAGKVNEIQDRIVANPRTREMLNRRIRSLTDEFLATGYFETRIDALVNLIAPDVLLDREKWGNSAHFGGRTLPVAEEASRIKTEYLARRLPYLTEFHVNGGVGLPEAQPTDATLGFGIVDASSSGESQSEYLTLVNENEVAIDISGWTLGGAVTASLAPGTVVPAGESIYLTADVSAFRARETGPSGGQGLIVQAYAGDLPDAGGRVTLSNSFGVEVASRVYTDVRGEADFDGDGDTDVNDLDVLSAGIRQGGDVRFDLNQDGEVDAADRNLMIGAVLNTGFGDSNLDGNFNSADLVVVFAAGQYEDETLGNSGWAQGDWDGDGDFSTSDLVAAFAAGRYTNAATAGPTPFANDLAIVDWFGDDDTGLRRSAATI